jgi:hypothetical protein
VGLEDLLAQRGETVRTLDVKRDADLLKGYDLQLADDGTVEMTRKDSPSSPPPPPAGQGGP